MLADAQIRRAAAATSEITISTIATRKGFALLNGDAGDAAKPKDRRDDRNDQKRHSVVRSSHPSHLSFSQRIMPGTPRPRNVPSPPFESTPSRSIRVPEQRGD